MKALSATAREPPSSRLRSMNSSFSRCFSLRRWTSILAACACSLRACCGGISGWMPRRSRTACEEWTIASCSR